MVTTHFDKLDGFNNVTVTMQHITANEQVLLHKYIIDCDEFVYKSGSNHYWWDDIWLRAKAMYKKEVKRVIQP